MQVLKLSSLMGLIFISLALLTKGYVSVAFIALLGLANSLVWPSIWPLAINGLGRFTKIGSSFLIVAVGGGALLPFYTDGWQINFLHIRRIGLLYLVICVYGIMLKRDTNSDYNLKIVRMILVADGGSTNTNWCLLNATTDIQYFDTEGYNPYFVSVSYIVQSLRQVFTQYQSRTNSCNIFLRLGLFRRKNE